MTNYHEVIIKHAQCQASAKQDTRTISFHP